MAYQDRRCRCRHRVMVHLDLDGGRVPLLQWPRQISTTDTADDGRKRGDDVYDDWYGRRGSLSSCGCRRRSGATTAGGRHGDGDLATVALGLEVYRSTPSMVEAT